MVVLDNSSYMINGDYPPTRWDAQMDATGILLASRSNINAENAVGLATMAGRSVEVLCTPTADNSRVSACMAEAKVSGEIHFVEALKICALVLKNRQNTALRQRIFMFVGSTIREKEEELKGIARKLNKHQIAVTVAAFGDLSGEQRGKLDTFVQLASQEDNSSVIYIDTGRNICDSLLDAPVFSGGAEKFATAELEAEDPELKMALEMSLKDEEDRRKRETAAQAPKPDKMEVEVDKPKQHKKDEFELTEEEAQRIAEDLNKQEQMAMEVEKDEPADKDDEKKKKKEDDKDTIASRGLEGTERSEGTLRGADFLTNKSNTIKSQDTKFMTQLEEMAQDDSDEELKGDDKDKDKEKKNKEKKKNQTEKH